MKYFYIVLTFLLLISCSKNNEPILKEFETTKSINFNNLEKVDDVRSLFTVSLPKHWKTNLYYDNSQTSIYSADTTKNLTNSVLIDQTLIHQELKLNNAFLQKLKTNSLKTELKDSILKETTFLNKPSLLQYSIGKKGTYEYRILQIYSQINSANFLHSKIEIYGDSLVKNRIYQGLHLIAKTQVK